MEVLTYSRTQATWDFIENKKESFNAVKRFVTKIYLS